MASKMLAPPGRHRDHLPEALLLVPCDEAEVRSILPHRKAGARGPPCIHHFGVRSGSGSDPFEQVEYQRFDRTRHRGQSISEGPGSFVWRARHRNSTRATDCSWSRRRLRPHPRRDRHRPESPLPPGVGRSSHRAHRSSFLALDRDVDLSHVGPSSCSSTTSRYSRMQRMHESRYRRLGSIWRRRPTHRTCSHRRHPSRAP